MDSVENSATNSKELTRGFYEFKENTEIKETIQAKNLNFIELAKSRRSIRGFKDKDLSKEQLMQLIDAAQSAPSAGNCQPWHFYVIKNKNLQTQIKELAYNQEWILTAPACIVVCTESARNEHRYGDRGRDLYCIQDTAAAIQNILLCAKNMGLGTCWCGAFDEAKLAEVLELNEGMRPVAVIPVGYPDKDSYPPQNRRPIEEVVTFIE